MAMMGGKLTAQSKRLVQSPAMLSTATPVILPAASKPNRRLVASPRGKMNFTMWKVAVLSGLH